jgi:ribulose-5-phosphate 4-epimerase/fuculose-1-phosphate aldolase
VTSQPIAEGVIQFRAEHSSKSLYHAQDLEVIGHLVAWRALLFKLGVIGQHAHRYDGLGFGNVSARVGAPSASPGARPFVITGTQTGGVERLEVSHFARVERYDLSRNQLWSHGLCRPSSESLTHGALYDLGPQLRAVFHVHSPEVWHAHRALRLPTTSPEVGYGTVAMARAMRKAWQDGGLAEAGVVVMLGHEDGVVAVGKSPEEAGQRLVKVWVDAVHGACRAKD